MNVKKSFSFSILFLDIHIHSVSTDNDVYIRGNRTGRRKRNDDISYTLIIFTFIPICRFVVFFSIYISRSLLLMFYSHKIDNKILRTTCYIGGRDS